MKNFYSRFKLLYLIEVHTHSRRIYLKREKYTYINYKHIYEGRGFNCADLILKVTRSTYETNKEMNKNS